MNRIFAIILCVYFVCTILPLSLSKNIVDKGDHVLICSQEPIEFGIVLDSSVSIQEGDFDRAKEFLVNFLSQFDIGPGPNDVRVSIVTYGMGVYRRDGFNLDKYKKKQDVLDAIMKVPHRRGLRTDTGYGIKYMHNKQLADSKVRPTADKISLVITDGNSQSARTTKREAASARNDNITIFAIGVGRENQVGMRELINIAGDQSRVTRVTNFASLNSIRKVLAKKTCLRKEKPTTTPMPNTESCGEADPADVAFIFSPSDLGLDATAWTTSFIGNVIDGEDMDVGFHYGVNSGSCPLDSGFNLGTYDFVDDIHDHLSYYDTLKLPSLVTMDVFDSSRGGRSYARDVAVIFVGSGKSAHVVTPKVKELLDNGVKVFIANPAGYPINIAGATALSGRSSRQQSEYLINMLCPEE